MQSVELLIRLRPGVRIGVLALAEIVDIKQLAAAQVADTAGTYRVSSPTTDVSVVIKGFKHCPFCGKRFLRKNNRRVGV